MDTGEGHFKIFENEEELKKNMHKMLNDYPNHGGVFREGDEFEIRGSRFRVAKVIRNGLKLELLPSVGWKED